MCAFLLSGAASLIHEVIWTRMLRLVMGNTINTVATVLCAYMAGLALGSMLGGRLIDRRSDPLLAFGILEAVIAVYCLLLPWIIDAAGPLYAALYQVTHATTYAFLMSRFAMCILLLLIPATLMGATLPVLIRFYSCFSDRVGASAGILYAVNSFGAALGAGITGFVLIPRLGVMTSIGIGSLLNFGVAGLALLLHRRAPACTSETKTTFGEPWQQAESSRSSRPMANNVGRWTLVTLLIGYGLSGFAALVYEIAWTRVLSSLIGSSVYAFSIMLSAFILGLSAGSLVFSRFVDRFKDPIQALGFLQAAIGLSALLVVPAFGELPLFVTALIARNSDSFWQLQFAEFGLVFLVMLVPTTLMGATFPLVSRAYVQGIRFVGRSIGTLYASNTAGTIFGSFAGGFLLVPWLGLQHTIFAAVSVNLLVACMFFGCSRMQLTGKGAVTALVIALAALGMTLIPPWDASRMSFGPFMQAVWLSQADAASTKRLNEILDETTTVFHKEGVTTTVTVNRDAKGTLTLLTNGRNEASSTGGERQQKLLAHLPLLLHPNPHRVLEIGLASGMTLSSASLYPVETLDCVEISEEVIEATRFFDEYNRRILDDPRVRIIVTDGRNHLALSGKEYDVIISQPSDPAVAGVADLFTQEFFELCHQQLTSDGQLCIWLKATTIEPEVFRSVVHTIDSVFEETTVWTGTNFTEYLIVGSKSPLAVDDRDLRQRMQDPAVANDLRGINIGSLPELLSHLVLDREETELFSSGARVHTDDNALLEFSAPRSVFARQDIRPLFDELMRYQRDGFSFLVPAGVSEERNSELERITDKASRFRMAKRHVLLANTHIENREIGPAVDELRKAADLNPDDPGVMSIISRLHVTTARFIESNRIRDAIRICRVIASVQPAESKNHFNLACLLRDNGEIDAAITHFGHVVRIDPENHVAHYNLALLAKRLGRDDEAIAHYRRTLALKPNLHQALNNLAWILATKLHPEAGEAVRLAERACELTDHSDVRPLKTLSVAYEANKQIPQALATTEKALSMALATGRDELVPGLRSRLNLLKRDAPD